MHTKFWLVMVLPMALLMAAQVAPLEEPQAEVSAEPAAPAVAPTGPSEQSPALTQLWDDFNHYVLIARPELAAAAGEALLQRAQPQELIDIVEASRFQNYEQTLVRAAKMPVVASVAARLDAAIRQGQVGHIREPHRLREAVARLGEGQRAELRAVDLLREAGQFSAPCLLETLQNPQQQRLHPYVRSAMVRIGQPLVYPLSVALGQLDPSLQRQIAQILGQIGYGRALPYLKELLDTGRLDPETAQVVQTAYNAIASAAGQPTNASADQLFLRLGNDFFQAESRGLPLPGYDAQTERGIVWQYAMDTGLVAVPVPGPIFGDVLAMDAARRALLLNPNLDPALSLWLGANLRRENRLPEGQTDSTYRLPNPASFYAMMAGPPRQQDVLAVALADRDSELARDAIAALAATAGTFQMVQGGQAAQPLLEALSYPDRRVRFEAALALTNARPTTPFPGSFRVVPVLAEALRQTAQRFALVIAPQDQLRDLVAAINAAGFTPISGAALADVADQVQAAPGVDLIIAAGNAASLRQLIDSTAQDYKLRNAPVVAVVGTQELASANDTLGRQPRVFLTHRGPEAPQLAAVIERATQSVAGQSLEGEQAGDYAMRALMALRDVAITRGEVFNVIDAQPALIESLRDPRQPIVIAAANVLSLVNSEDAQRAIAELAVQPQQPEELRIALLRSLAESATYWGNRLTPIQLDRISAIVTSSQGELALAASRAHGALALPTANVVRMLVQ